MKNTKKDKEMIAYCGFYCGECPWFKGTIADLSRDLRKELRSARLDKLAEFLSTFPAYKEYKNYQHCYELLGSIMKLRCKKICREGGPMPSCKIRKCGQNKGFEGCWECEEFETCEKMDFLKPGHGDAHIKSLRILKKKGTDEFIKGKKYWYTEVKT